MEGKFSRVVRWEIWMLIMDPDSRNKTQEQFYNGLHARCKILSENFEYFQHYNWMSTYRSRRTVCAFISSGLARGYIVLHVPRDQMDTGVVE